MDEEEMEKKLCNLEHDFEEMEMRLCNLEHGFIALCSIIETGLPTEESSAMRRMVEDYYEALVNITGIHPTSKSA